MKNEETTNDYVSKINNIKINFLYFGVDHHRNDVAYFNVECDGTIFGECSLGMINTCLLLFENFHEPLYWDAKWKDGKTRDNDFMQALVCAVDKKAEPLVPIWQADFENGWEKGISELSGFERLNAHLQKKLYTDLYCGPDKLTHEDLRGPPRTS